MILDEFNCAQMTYRFHCPCHAPSCDMGAKPDGLSVSGRPRHDVKRGGEEPLECVLYIMACEMPLWVPPANGATARQQCKIDQIEQVLPYLDERLWQPTFW
jgi:hypothetical protein